MRKYFQEILCVIFIVSAIHSFAASEFKIGIYSDELPGRDSTIAPAIYDYLSTAGYAPIHLNSNDILTTKNLASSKCNLLVIPESRNFPGAAVSKIYDYWQDGGYIIVLNGPPFMNPYWKTTDGKWMGKTEYLEQMSQVKADKLILDFDVMTERDLSGWKRGCNDLSRPSKIKIVKTESGTNCLMFDIKEFSGWDTFQTTLIQPYPANNELMCFQAKGGPKTTQISMEWAEKDGSRWIATIDITTGWRSYVLAPQDFKYWFDSPTLLRRGNGGDRFHPENAEKLSIGLAMTHTNVPSGDHQFWINQIGTAKIPPGGIQVKYDLPVMEGICPDYKFYPLTNVKEIQGLDLSGLSLTQLTTGAFSPVWKPQGTGFNKNRTMRYIPILKTNDDRGIWNGTLASMVLSKTSTQKWSLIGNMSFGNSEVYKNPKVLSVLGDMIQRMKKGCFFLEAGTEYFAYFGGDSTYKTGIEILNLSKDTQALEIVQTVYNLEMVGNNPTEINDRKKVTVAPGKSVRLETIRNFMGKKSDKGYWVTTEVSDNNGMLDRLAHTMNIWKPNLRKNFITTNNGEFYSPAAGKKWVPFGVNYMPSSGTGMENMQWFEHWLDSPAYDPEIVEADLQRIESVLKLNMISVFKYSGHTTDRNLIDLLVRARSHHLKVNMSLRPYADPLNFKLECPQELIWGNRLAENDDIFAYDIAWEPWFGGYEKRRVWDEQWAQWVKDQYGSISNAEKEWQYLFPRDEKIKYTSPTDLMLSSDGNWRLMVAAYRRFVDDLVGSKYRIAIRKIKELDPNHLVSFRMSEAGNPECNQAGYPMDLRGLASAVDFFAPEGYGRFNDQYKDVRTGVFTAAYARSLAKKPLFWAEFGKNVWSGSNFTPSNLLMQYEQAGYENFMRMMCDSQSQGGATWWYPGGYRVGENSDYGMLNPDGSPRYLQGPLDMYRDLIVQPNRMSSYLEFNEWMTIDRDKHPDGIYGIYQEVKEEYWKKVNTGKRVGLRTEGKGMNSLNVPLIAIGNLPYTGTNPVKYLNGMFVGVKVKDVSGKWVTVEEKQRIILKKAQPIEMEITVANNGDADWLSLQNADSKEGRVYIVSTKESNLSVELPVMNDVPSMQESILKNIELDPAGKVLDVVLRFKSYNRCQFGETFRFTLVPEDLCNL